MNRIIDYLKQVTAIMDKIYSNSSLKYKCQESFVLTHGREFEVCEVPLPLFKIKKGEIKECFTNAYFCAKKHDFIYVEGFAISDDRLPFPVLHAWCVTENGYVVDPTWKYGMIYYGVPFDIKFVEATMLKRKYYGVIDNPEMGFPLLRGDAKNFLDRRLENGHS